MTEPSSCRGGSAVHTTDVRRFRVLMTVVIVGLVLSGVTAFALLTEVELLARVLRVPEEGAAAVPAHGPHGWIAAVRDGLREMHAAYPWSAYGTDWLAFGHLVIAVFFIGPLIRPQRDHRWILMSGIVACVGVLPLAICAGEVRGIPWGWRAIDCAFSLICIVPLLWALRIHRRVLCRQSA